ncbi:MAG: hypothetical protein ACQ5SW_11405 [Sphaerochaetaceae bacterium]
MDNRKWYTETIRFCKLSTSCASCPYYLLTGERESQNDVERPCFSSKEALLALDEWLAEEHVCGQNGLEDGNDHQWLQELLLQFDEEEEESDLFFEEDLF